MLESANTSNHSTTSHCVDRIFDLAKTESITASEDILDANGVKLWAKGAAISPELKARLEQRRLKTPLEMNLELVNSVTTGMIVDDCLNALADSQELLRLAGTKAAEAALSRLRLITLPSPIRLLLTTVYKGQQKSYRNAIYTVTICAGFAAKHNLSAQETESLLVAALLHDLGEIYIAPDYLDSSRPVSADEWVSVSQHPTIGFRVARDLGRLPQAVTTAIAQHHERMDGSGYPGMLAGTNIAATSRIIAAADAVAAIIARGQAGAAYHTTLALKIIPEEFDRQCVNFVQSALQDLAASTPVEEVVSDVQVRAVAARVKLSQQMIKTMLDDGAAGVTRDALLMADGVCHNVAKALRSTGIEQLLMLDEATAKDLFTGESCQVSREIGWRLRNVGRNIHLRVSGRGGPGDVCFMKPLLDILGAQSPKPAAT